MEMKEKGERRTVLDTVARYHFAEYLLTKFVSSGMVSISVFLGTGLEPTVHQLQVGVILSSCSLNFICTCKVIARVIVRRII